MKPSYDTSARSLIQLPDLVPGRPSARDKEPFCRVESHHRALADRIRTFVVATGHVPSAQHRRWSWAIARMARHMARHGVPFEEIETVWAWYETEYRPGTKALPRILDAQQFRDRWDWIVGRMNAVEASKPLAAEQLTDETRAVLRELSGLVWRADVDPIVPLAVQRSLAAVRAFYDRLRVAPASGVRDHVLASTGSPRSVVVAYFRWLHADKDRGWSRWNGDLLRWTWDVTRPECVADLVRAVRSYTGSDTAWAKLMLSLEGC